MDSYFIVNTKLNNTSPHTFLSLTIKVLGTGYGTVREEGYAILTATPFKIGFKIV